MTPSEEQLVAGSCGLTIVSLSLENERVQEFCFRQLLTSKQDIYEYNHFILSNVREIDSIWYFCVKGHFEQSLHIHYH